jgi:multidrug resistance efflux pump
MSTPALSKLAELRAKTDQQLLQVILRELDRALPMAKAAANKASPLYLRAEKAYARVRPLVSKVEAVSEKERADLEAKLREVEVALERAASKVSLSLR